MKKKTKPTAKHDAYGEATYNQILQVATKLFAEKGFDGVTTKEICDTAQANISSLHYHFETKNKLFFKIVDELGSTFKDVTSRYLTPPQNSEEMKIKLELYLMESLSFFNSSIYLHRIIHHEMGLATDRSADICKSFTPIVENIKKFFHEAKKNKILHEKVDPDFVAFFFLKQLQPDFDPHQIKKEIFNIDTETVEGRQIYVKNSIQYFLEGIIQR